ncbi:methyltransferase domain-containing protein [Catellatospora sp. KI3]|uniref:class I SAM-dependent methyltransferase n=1 Tax=Catellatospora sp. KI3 TaxID=3041620 RepID=UPI0024832538|nr:methyltransferase domain-containing protein [Catellatospora sp. KI3]MDI1465001.1 methyltransferase domain-containing protein [Catellatospora sp. KI3]
MSAARPQGLVFGEVAEEFDRIRPGYPAALVDDVLAYTGPGTRALEVGAGTGKATTAFAVRGLDITAVEPDPAMAALLEQRLGERSAVRIVAALFEGYTPDAPFDLLYCAQAWQWTDSSQRWARAAAALAPGGVLALFWNFDRIADDELRALVREVHEPYAPHAMLDEEPADGTDLSQYWPGPDLAALPEFGDLAERIYLWERTLSADDYVSYLSTQPTYRMLPEATREALFAALLQRLPEKLTLSVETLLYLGRRTA